MSGWAFAQLRTFVEYKARLQGVPVVLVDPRHTSQECSCCHHVARGNRVFRKRSSPVVGAAIRSTRISMPR